MICTQVATHVLTYFLVLVNIPLRDFVCTLFTTL